MKKHLIPEAYKSYLGYGYNNSIKVSKIINEIVFTKKNFQNLEMPVNLNLKQIPKTPDITPDKPIQYNIATIAYEKLKALMNLQ